MCCLMAHLKKPYGYSAKPVAIARVGLHTHQKYVLRFMGELAEIVVSNGAEPTEYISLPYIKTPEFALQIVTAETLALREWFCSDIQNPHY